MSVKGTEIEDNFREWWGRNSEAPLTTNGMAFHAFTSGFILGKASSDGLRKALEKIAGEDRCDNRTVSASMAIAMMALEADGEVVE